ncbi:MAG: L-iditol 2-dehydrogenase [Rickettsiales bacterium]|nr:L-iditol 2-dehydrogenase [Rickettsiales bacterium]
MDKIVLNEPGSFSFGSGEVDSSLAENEVLLKVHSVGICGTDMHAYRGKQPFFSYPRILGHELGVEVIALGNNVTTLQVGDKCSVEPYFNVVEGQAVRNGKPNCGEQISVFGVHEDGGMRDYIKLPAHYLHKSSKLSYEQLALVETLGIGCHAVNRAMVNAEDLVLIIGAGPIGLSAVEFAKLKAKKVVVMDVNDDRLEFCTERMGVDGTINLLKEDVETSLRNLFDGDLPTVVFDATGNPESMKNTLEYVAHGGRIVFIGLFQGDFIFFDPLFHRKEISLLASRNALSQDFKEIIHLMETNQLDITPWITHRLKKTELINQFDNLLKPESKVLKAMVDFS